MSLIDDIIAKADQLKTLQIRTIVGNFTDDGNGVTKDATASEILTRIDLLDGDITTAFNEKFLTSPYDTIRDFHADREKEGRAIIEKNIEVLGKLIDLLLDAIRKKDQTA